jgi:hypothetical protein
MQIVDSLQSPHNNLSEDNKKKHREITLNADNAIKTSLVNLFIERFNKIALYDKAIQDILDEVTLRASSMEHTDLVALLGVLTRTSASESKNVMDMFKKNGNDFGTLAKELNKLNSNLSESSKKKEEEDSSKSEVSLSQEELDRVLRFIEKVDTPKDDPQ